MNIAQHSELVERLAAAYALGTLRGPARRRFEALARQHPAVRAAVLTWESRWSGLTEIQAEHTPPAAVWRRIDNLVQADQAQAKLAQAQQSAKTSAEPLNRWWNPLRMWQGAALASLAVAALVAVNVGQPRTELAQAPQERQGPDSTEVVAILADSQAKAQLVVSYSTVENALLVLQVGAYRAASDKDLQLWALPTGRAPISLGVLARDGIMLIPLRGVPLSAIPALAVSLEPLGGVPGHSGPTGPVIFKGPVIRKDT